MSERLDYLQLNFYMRDLTLNERDVDPNDEISVLSPTATR